MSNVKDSAIAAGTTSVSAPPRPVIAQPGEGVLVRAFGNEILFKLTTEQSGGALVVGLATVPAQGTVPAHVQTREDELFIIVEGTYRFWIDGVESDAGPGALVFVPRNVPHKFQVLGETAGRHWVLNAPGGFDHFFARSAEVFAAPGTPDFGRIAAINAEFGTRIV